MGPSPDEASMIKTGRAVLCDDDALVRSVIRKVLEHSPIEIVGEADSSEAAMEVIRDFEANVLVLDLALRSGSGEHLLRWVREQDRAIHVVVYSAYATDHRSLLEAGAAAVIEKPDFEGLRAAIDGIAAGLGIRVDRRRKDPDRAVRSMPPATARSRSGFEPWSSFLAAVEAALPGDAMLCVDVAPDPSDEDRWDHVFGLDHRVALGRAMARGGRLDERVSLTPDGRPMVLLVAGNPGAPTAYFARLADQWRRDAHRGTPVGAFGLVHEGEDPLARLVGIEAAVTFDHTDPLRMV